MGVTVAVVRGRTATTCPTRALRAWLEAAGITEGAIFRSIVKGGHVRSTRLSDKAVAGVVKAYAKRPELDAADFSGDHALPVRPDYWADDGTALYKTPTGAMWHGKWEIKNTLCADWKERPNNPCTRYDKTGDTVSVLDSASGQTRAKIVKTAPGNAEKLAP